MGTIDPVMVNIDMDVQQPRTSSTGFRKFIWIQYW